MSDGYVQVAPDSTGKKIDNAELTRDDGTVIERQRIVLADDENPRVQVAVGGEPGRGAVGVGGESVELLRSIDLWLKMLVVAVALHADHDVEQLMEVVKANYGE